MTGGFPREVAIVAQRRDIAFRVKRCLLKLSHLAMMAKPTNNVRIYRMGSQHYIRKNVGRKEEGIGKVIQAE